MKMKAPKLTKSAEIVASIDDLLTEILLRLPIKSLLCFKTVSKQWYSLITNPNFRRRRNRNPNPAIGLFLPRNNYQFYPPSSDYVPFYPNKSTTTPPFTELNFTKDPSGIEIMRSCNGLLLCKSSTANKSKTRHYVYNPTTTQFHTLPKLRPKLHGGGGGVTWLILDMTLAFDPTKSPHYKVVCVRTPKPLGSDQYQIEIYSSEIGSWRISGDPFTAMVSFDGVYWNGAIHWIRFLDGDSLYFDVHRQVLEKMPTPPISGDQGWSRDYYFGESGDHLHYIHMFKPHLEFDVYEMKRDYSEWFLKYHVDLSALVADNPGMIRANCRPTDMYYYTFSILSIIRGEEEDDSFLVLKIPGKLIRFNLVSKAFENLHEYGSSFNFVGPNVFQYIESLCCI